MVQKISKELAKHRLEQAKEDLEAGKLLYDKNFYKSANNRAYYSIFHSIKAVLALEPIDFKRHKDVLAYFNKNYINKEIFSRMMGRKIQNASAIREDSDYDDEFIVDADKTNEQLKTAEELIELVDKYIDINVPSVIILVIYRLVAITEKPHCGITPSREPIIGPIFFDLVIMFFVLLFNLCSNNSIIRKATNKNGINFNESTIVSKITSFICYHSVFNYNINIILVQLYFIHFSFIRWSFW